MSDTERPLWEPPANAIQLRPPEPQGLSQSLSQDQGEIQPEEPSVAMLVATIEEMDRGMKLMINVISEQEKRIRQLELGMRRVERRNAGALVDVRGQAIKSRSN